MAFRTSSGLIGARNRKSSLRRLPQRWANHAMRAMRAMTWFDSDTVTACFRHPQLYHLKNPSERSLDGTRPNVMGWQCLKDVFWSYAYLFLQVQHTWNLWIDPSNRGKQCQEQSVVVHEVSVVVDQQHLVEFYPSRNFPPVDVFGGHGNPGSYEFTIDLDGTVWLKFIEINHMCHFSLSSNLTRFLTLLICIKLVLLSSRQEDPLAAAGIPDWLRDQFAVPKLPPEPVVRSGQRKVKVHWAMAGRSELVHKFNDFHGLSKPLTPWFLSLVDSFFITLAMYS